MTTEQRKIALINWITDLENESLMNKIEALKSASFDDIPDEIISLLNSSNSVGKSELIEHKTAKDLLIN